MYEKMPYEKCYNFKTKQKLLFKICYDNYKTGFKFVLKLQARVLSELIENLRVKKRYGYCLYGQKETFFVPYAVMKKLIVFEILRCLKVSYDCGKKLSTRACSASLAKMLFMFLLIRC